jgi:hypothetical protein
MISINQPHLKANTWNSQPKMRLCLSRRPTLSWAGVWLRPTPWWAEACSRPTIGWARNASAPDPMIRPGYIHPRPYVGQGRVLAQPHVGLHFGPGHVRGQPHIGQGTRPRPISCWACTCLRPTLCWVRDVTTP